VQTAPISPPAASPWSANPVPPAGVPPAPALSAAGQPGVAAAGRGLTLPLPAIVGGVLVLAVLIVAVVMANGGSGNAPGIAYTPSTVSCTGETISLTVRLPASVQTTDALAFAVDGQVWPAGDYFSVTSAGYTLQPDGTWLFEATEDTPAAVECTLPVGTHTVQILNASGGAIATGSLVRQ
jgi:hypothetical protein